MILLKVIAEDEGNILADAFVEFIDTEKHKKYFLRGRFMGYDHDKGYIVLPIRGRTENLFDGDEVATFPTKRFEAIPIRSMRIIWDILSDYDFEIEKETVFKGSL